MKIKIDQDKLFKFIEDGICNGWTESRYLIGIEDDCQIQLVVTRTEDELMDTDVETICVELI